MFWCHPRSRVQCLRSLRYDVQGGKDVGVAVDDHSASHAKGILLIRPVCLHHYQRRQYGLVDLRRHRRIRGQGVHGLRNRRLHVHGLWLLLLGAESSPEYQGEQQNHHAKRDKRQHRQPLPQRPPGPSPSRRAGVRRTVGRIGGLRLRLGPVRWNRSGARNLPPGCQTLRPMQVSAMNFRPKNRQRFPAIVSQPFQENVKVSGRHGRSQGNCLNQNGTYAVESHSLPLRGRVRVGVKSPTA